MLAFERKKSIKSILLNEHSVSVNYLATYFDVSEETIRRDLEVMQEEGILTRTHGGATINKFISEDLPYKTRNTLNMDAKQAIAKKVLPLIKDGYSIMTDTSSTVYEAIKMLRFEERVLTFITNSVEVLRHQPGDSITIISTGGTLRKDSLSLVGPVAISAVTRYNVDLALFSCKALSKKFGVMESNDPESELKMAMLSQARKVIMLIDSTKFDEIALISLFPFSDIDYIVTDQEPSHEWKTICKQHHIELLY